METSKGKLSSIENLAAQFPPMCGPVPPLSGVTVLSIDKVSALPNNGKGKGQGEKGKKGKRGKKGKGMIEAGTQKMQPVHLGGDEGRVICTLAAGDHANRIPSKVLQNAYVGMSPLKPSHDNLASSTGPRAHRCHCDCCQGFQHTASSFPTASRATTLRIVCPWPLRGSAQSARAWPLPCV